MTYRMAMRTGLKWWQVNKVTISGDDFEDQLEAHVRQVCFDPLAPPTFMLILSYDDDNNTSSAYLGPNPRQFTDPVTQMNMGNSGSNPGTSPEHLIFDFERDVRVIKQRKFR